MQESWAGGGRGRTRGSGKGPAVGDDKVWDVTASWLVEVGQERSRRVLGELRGCGTDGVIHMQAYPPRAMTEVELERLVHPHIFAGWGVGV